MIISGLEKLHRVYQSVPSSPTISPDTNKDVGFYEQRKSHFFVISSAVSIRFKLNERGK